MESLDDSRIMTRSAAVCGVKGHQPQQPRTLRRAAAGLRHSRAPKAIYRELQRISSHRKYKPLITNPFILDIFQNSWRNDYYNGNGHGQKAEIMKMKFFTAAVTAFCIFSGHVSTVLAQGATAFTYQGLLRNSGTNVTGTNSLIFSLYNSAAGGTQIGTPITNSLAVSNGLFTVSLDFGADAFNGSARWLDIAVSNSPANQELSPRAQVLPTPYATFAANAAIAGTASNFNGGVVQGSFIGYGAGLTNVAATLQMQVFLTSGTFITPSNVTSIIVEVWGGGGMGASGSPSYDVGGGGGGAGGYAKALYAVTPNTSYAVVVGAGGTAGAPTGGSSGMGGVILATGGSPGSAPTSIAVTPGGAGGTGAATSSTTSSTKGGTGKYGTPDGGGDGGNAPCGGPGGLGSFGATPEAGHVPGGGGGGGDFAGVTAGAAGGYGEVIVYY